MTPTNGEMNRKSEKVRRANRTIQNRTLILMAFLGVGVFIALFFKLFSLQILRHDELEAKALDQQTRSTVVTATRGTIYDRNGNIMAISATAETVFLSPLEMNRALNDKDAPVTWTKDSVAQRLSEILQINKEGILKKMERTDSQYEVLKMRIEEDAADQIRSYINDEGVVGVYMATDAKRYYPYSTLASQVIGFVGTDNTGLYGLEARYNSTLEGQTGLVVSTKDPAGNDMLYGYEQYYKAKNGSDIVLTLDATVQYYVEKAINEMVTATEAANGATGIVMDVETGAVLAMASSPGYDLNDPSSIYDAAVAKLVSEKKLDLADAQLRQWRNKAINDTYEPGSTFKIITAAAGLESGVVTPQSTFSCPGFIIVEDRKIRCHKVGGHGSEDFVHATMNSCNPVFITVGLRMGVETYYDYFEKFGLLQKTGVDLPGEAGTIMHKEENIGAVELATISFGQSFQITPIKLLTTAASIVNGGNLITPHFGVEVTDAEGNCVETFEYPVSEQIVSSETSATMREMLEKVVAEGGGKKAYIEGVRIGGKTATSQTLPRGTGKYIASFVGFAPADDPEIIAMAIITHPTGTYYGGQIAAPVVKQLFENILPYLGIMDYNKNNGAEIPAEN